ncbi:MAG: DUF3035 domain-containing protein [Micavibrio aeruginosavorus]|uniref:DUF3035 domain-containing protein n=1 Tax=Micavibrio aeruginosavorus TaxID=349221 RepID=A0A2W4ZTI7_9BACT|nr:MAG: DUF3035 domain-containing protein [Micavibrio aeruginosavorus]
MTRKVLVLTFLAGASLLLQGCSEVREQFDFSKKAPDEFKVVTRAPLEMPANLNSLPAPKPGAARPQEITTEQMARQSILGEGAAYPQTANSMTQGEASLLQRSGAANASPAIRAKVDQETAELIEGERPGIDKLKRMVGMTPAEPSKEAVDPVKEIERIKQNKAQGKPITAGQVPTIGDR